MRFQALACDYDGTLAFDDRIGEEALAALERARGAGLRFILVTGRTFFELIRVCERLDFFDAVVAENGGVLYFPTTGVMHDQAPPPPPRLLAELDRRSVPFQLGRVIVGTWRNEEPRVREALAAVGIGMAIIYNRAALMLLRPGVSKGKGVEQAIRALGLSFHDVLALGDAENDLDLFEACGWTACPANAVPELKDRADWIFPGDDGASIAAAIDGPILSGLLPMARSRRHQVALGWLAETSEEAVIAERGINVLIQGDPFSGKSWLSGVLIERLLGRRYAVCIIDPEGDYQVLAPLPGVTWTDVVDDEDLDAALAPFDHDPQACIVLDLSTLPQARKVGIIERGLELLRERRHRRGTRTGSSSTRRITRCTVKASPTGRSAFRTRLLPRHLPRELAPGVGGSGDRRLPLCPYDGHQGARLPTPIPQWTAGQHHLDSFDPPEPPAGGVPPGQAGCRGRTRADVRGGAADDVPRAPSEEVYRRPATGRALLLLPYAGRPTRGDRREPRRVPARGEPSRRRGAGVPRNAR
jgi:hydroxymethylpyrimidine pyrophosphatase-like HAD family hydrolase